MVGNPLPYRYLLFNKPFNVLCQFTPGTGADTKIRKTLADFIAVLGVYPVGRLDLDSEGLLLLTDDGILQNRLSEPTYGHARTYLAQVEGLFTNEAASLLHPGIKLGDYQTKPAEVRLIETPDLEPRDPPIRFRKSIPTSWIQLKLTEGRNRQVRRMTAAVGFPTLRLVRVEIDFLKLGDLPPGVSRAANAQEIKHLLDLRANDVRAIHRPPARRRA